MGYIRFGWTALGTFLMFVISLPILLTAWLIGLFNMKGRDAITMWVVRWSFKAVMVMAGVKAHISGYENIPKDKAVLYIGNHRSFFDVLSSYTLFPGMTSFIAKKQFEKVPMLSWWMKLLHNLFLDRDDIKQGLQTILTAIEYVKGGMSVVIFPEGTRNKTEEDILPFHEGSFKISTKTDCPIIPMTMYNMSAVFEDHFPQLKPQHVFVDFGKPIIPSELEPEQRKHIGVYVRGIMLDKYDELRKEHEKIVCR